MGQHRAVVVELDLQRFGRDPQLKRRLRVLHDEPLEVGATLGPHFEVDESPVDLPLENRFAGPQQDGLADGAMLSVPLSGKDLKQRLAKEEELSIAAVNAETLCVVSGPPGPVKRFQEQLEEEGYECLPYRVPKAGHSRMVEPIMKEFKEKIKKVKFHKPRIPFISCISGTWITAEQAVDPGYAEDRIDILDRLDMFDLDNNDRLIVGGCNIFLKILSVTMRPGNPNAADTFRRVLTQLYHSRYICGCFDLGNNDSCRADIQYLFDPDFIDRWYPNQAGGLR